EPAEAKEPGIAMRAGLVSQSPVLHASLKLQLEAAGMEMIELTSLDPGGKIDCDVILLDAGVGEGQLPDVTGVGVPVAVLLPPRGRAQLAELSDKGIAFYLMKPVRQASLESQLKQVFGGAEEIANDEEFAETIVPYTPPKAILLAEDNEVNALLAR